MEIIRVKGVQRHFQGLGRAQIISLLITSEEMVKHQDTLGIGKIIALDRITCPNYFAGLITKKNMGTGSHTIQKSYNHEC